MIALSGNIEIIGRKTELRVSSTRSKEGGESTERSRVKNTWGPKRDQRFAARGLQRINAGRSPRGGEGRGRGAHTRRLPQTGVSQRGLLPHPILKVYSAKR